MRPESDLVALRYYSKDKKGQYRCIKDHTLCASSTTRTFPVPTSARTNKRVIISNNPQASAVSIKGSDMSIMVSWPGANLGF